MANTHAYPDSFYELQATWGDLGPQVIVSHSGLTVPASSLTMPSVAANGYVLSPGPPARLVYVSQPAVSVTFPSTAATYWLAVHADLHTPVSGWTRRSGSHVLFQASATQPANPAGALVFASVVVAGAVVTTVTPLTAVTSAPMSRQNSSAVAITGGSATGLTTVGVAGGNLTVNTGNLQVTNGAVGLSTAPIAGVALAVGAPARFTDVVGLGAGSSNSYQLLLQFDKATRDGIYLRGLTDGAGRSHIIFANNAGGPVGSIQCTATATAYNTSSDVRLKRNIQPLTDALTTLLALKPVTFRWNADDSEDEGFLAHELQQHIPHAVTGEPDQVNEDGSIRPQQVDHSKLVVWLTAALQETVAQLTAVTARVQALEAALGL
jgi:hypothetical protein